MYEIVTIFYAGILNVLSVFFKTHDLIFIKVHQWIVVNLKKKIDIVIINVIIVYSCWNKMFY